MSIPAHLRPINFAGIELLLELIHVGRAIYDVDMESFIILLCVSDATMRPFMTDPGTSAAVLSAPRPPEALRGSISRRMIADKTGLARETVRRKVTELAVGGYVVIDSRDQIRIGQSLDDPRSHASLEQGHRAVLRYLSRLEQLGVKSRRAYP